MPGPSVGDSKTLMDLIKSLPDTMSAAQASYVAALSRANDRFKQQALDIQHAIEEAENTHNKAKLAIALAQQKELEKQQQKAEREAAKEYAKERAKSLDKEERKKGKKDLKDITKKEAEEAWEEAGGFVGKLKETFGGLNDQLGKGFKQNMKEQGTEQLIKSMKAVGAAITEGLNQINNAISKYAQYQTAINTRLQGTGRDFSNVSKTLNKVAFSPLVKAESLYENVNKLVEEGISYNLEQRAFLETVKGGIATTFEADNATLRRLIRVQQEDSTAARLGMEAYLTKFLNEFVSTTEYLTSTFDNVADHLLEASAMLGSADASAEFEYVVQKWLGTLTGIGLSDSTASSIAQAIGELGSGDISNLGSSNIQSLMVMAAARSGLDYAQILSGGLDSVDTNKLMLGLVNYMQEIGASSSNVVKNQLAKTFGVSVSDLVAVSKNLDSKNLSAVYNSMMSYSNMQNELVNEMSSMSSRMGIANILENLMSNITYQTGTNIASNATTYAIWKITDLIQGVTGGINIPYISVMGSGINLETTVENLMKLGIVGASFFSNIGNLVKGVSSVGNGKVLLDALNFSSGQTLTRGQGLSEYTLSNSGVKKMTSGTTVSSSTRIGNTDGSAYSENAADTAMESARRENADTLEDDSKDVVKYLSETVNLKEKLDAISEYLQSIKEGVVIKSVTSNPSGWTTDMRTSEL